VEQFKVFRAIGLAFKAWFASFFSITLLAAVLYVPIIAWVAMLPATLQFDDHLAKFQHALWALIGVSALFAPLITYQVIQYMNDRKPALATSIKFGVRGIVPALIIAVVTSLVQLAPMGGILGTIVTCYWFVGAPAAVVEGLNPIEALSRSAALTQGRRWGIFGLCLLLSLTIVIVFFAWLMPAAQSNDTDPLRHMIVALMVIIAVYQLFLGIVQAVSYSLLRADKDGVPNDELAKVFE